MTAPTYQVFVYGSLRSGFRNPAYRYLSDFFSLIGEAKVKGRFYDKGTYPVAVPTEDAYITGELYSANSPDAFQWAIAQLDDYEGLVVEAGETPLYKRSLVEVYHQDQTTTAWIYWFNGDTTRLPMIPTGDLLEYIQSKNHSK